MLTDQQKSMIANPRLSQVRAAAILARKLRQAGRHIEEACLHTAKEYGVSFEAVRLFVESDPEPQGQTGWIADPAHHPQTAATSASSIGLRSAG